MAKDQVIRFRCTEEERRMIEMLAAADPYSDNISEYLMSLVIDDAKYYKEVEIIGIVRGRRKGADEIIEKRRISLGTTLIDDHGRGSTKEFSRLAKTAKEEFGALLKQPSHYLVMEAGGKEIEPPNFGSDYFTVKEGA